MESSTVSAKYQVVIPKNVRKKLKVAPGQRVYFTLKKNNVVELDTGSMIDKMYGSMKGTWGEDSDKYLKELRKEWDDRDKRT